MSSIKVAIDGEAKFTWDGDEKSAAAILDEFPRDTTDVGMTPEQFANHAVDRLSRTELSTIEPVAREMAMMGVTWLILQADTKDADHPGKFGDYIGNTDFEVDFETGDEAGLSIYIRARSKFDS